MLKFWIVFTCILIVLFNQLYNIIRTNEKEKEWQIAFNCVALIASLVLLFIVKKVIV